MVFPVPFALLLFFGALGIDGPDNHERGDVDGDVAVGHYSK